VSGTDRSVRVATDAGRPSGTLGHVIGLLVLLFPVLLLGFMLFMQRVEEPLNRSDTSHDIERMLEANDPVDIELLVNQGTDTALRRYRSRRRWWHRRRSA
jgi:hypothetical protein